MSKVLRQVEYYFSDHSYPFDDFMKGQAAAEGNDGFVPISIIAGAKTTCPASTQKFRTTPHCR